MLHFATGIEASSCQAAFVFHTTLAIAVPTVDQAFDRHPKRCAALSVLRGFSAGSRAIRFATWRIPPRARNVPLAPEGRPACAAKHDYLATDRSVRSEARPVLNRRIDAATPIATTLPNGQRSAWRTDSPVARSRLCAAAAPASSPGALAK